jgi:hypothetical protein
MGLSIFVSHSSRYKDLAVQLKLSLQALETDAYLDIRISEDMAGAKDWRVWIEENVRSSDVFLLMYPHASMDMGWCNYELGRFYNEEKTGRYIACIKNVDISTPPPAFQPYQAYDASPAEIFTFLRELFVTGEFTNGKALNKEVGRAGTDFHARAREVANDLANGFTEARVKEYFYERRIVISLRYDEAGQLSHDKSTVQGNTEGLGLLGLVDTSTGTWATLRASLGDKGGWLSELEAALPAVITGALPPVLPPYRAQSGIYLPIVVKAEIGDGRPRQVIVIFVSAGIERLLPILGWSFPRAMPTSLTYLVVLFRSMFKARWEIVEPRYQQLRGKMASEQRCQEIAQDVIRDFDVMHDDFEDQGNAGLGQFYSAFNRDLRLEVEASSDEWLDLVKRLRVAAEQPGQDVEAILKALLKNNSRWLTVTSAQFSHAIADLQ